MYAAKTSKSANPFSHFPTGNRIYGLEIHGVTVKLFAEVEWPSTRWRIRNFLLYMKKNIFEKWVRVVDAYERNVAYGIRKCRYAFTLVYNLNRIREAYVVIVKFL